MFNNWLRNNKAAMWLLTVVRIYLGYSSWAGSEN